MDAVEPRLKEGGQIIDWHVCDLFPSSLIDLVVVLRTDSTLLYDRLSSRYVRSAGRDEDVLLTNFDSNYPEHKLQENLDAEIMQVLLDEAQESYDANIVVELQSNSSEDLESNVERIATWVRGWRRDNVDALPES